jgi:pyridinium-3,5-bisthiocarboxylic acid mononucleotide nickel chelatase
MNILYYDCFAGISGDMNLAAMIDLGVAPDYLRAELSKLGLDHEFELNVTSDSRHGIHGTRVDVVLQDWEVPPHEHEDSPHGHAHVHEDPTGGHGQSLVALPEKHAHQHANSPSGHEHTHSRKDVLQGQHHGHADSSSNHAHSHEDCPDAHRHGHATHRNLEDIGSIILASTLGDAIKKTSLAIFRKVAEAEARVHGKAVHEVHFHEVGAIDSIVDIVGAAICYHRLEVDAVWASPVELGGGFVRCAHGLIPVPAPATVEILQGIPTTRGAVKQETTTPTGAAILAALVDEFTDAPALVMKKTAYGIGHREADIPNVLRVHLARTVSSRAVGKVQQACL